MTLARLASIVLDAMLADSCSGSGKGSSSTTTATTTATGTGSSSSGRQVSFVARFVKAPKNGGSLGVKAKIGQPLLTRQGVYIVVPIDKLQLQ
jgi:hypothetical protein